MPFRKIKAYKYNNIAKKQQIRLKNRLNRLIYLKNTISFATYIVNKNSFYIRLSEDFY